MLGLTLMLTVTACGNSVANSPQTQPDLHTVEEPVTVPQNVKADSSQTTGSNESVVEKNKEPVKEEQEPTQTKESKTCILSIRYTDLLSIPEFSESPIKETLPLDGWILPPTEVSLMDEDSVFDVLQRETKSRGIHMEYSENPAFQSSYIEGMANLYQFDFGDKSGWIYTVNGEQYNIGSSRFLLSPGDRVEWNYSVSE